MQGRLIKRWSFEQSNLSTFRIFLFPQLLRSSFYRKFCKTPHPPNLVESFAIYQMATEEYLYVKTCLMVHLVTSYWQSWYLSDGLNFNNVTSVSLLLHFSCLLRPPIIVFTISFQCGWLLDNGNLWRWVWDWIWMFPMKYSWHRFHTFPHHVEERWWPLNSLTGEIITVGEIEDWGDSLSWLSSQGVRERGGSLCQNIMN